MYKPQNFTLTKYVRAKRERFLPNAKNRNSLWEIFAFVYFLRYNFDNSFNLLPEQTFMLEIVFRFSVKSGSNTFERRSIESNVTIPYEQTFRDLSNRPTDGEALQNYNYCGCGWPDHLLIPKGSADGYPAELFVMISDAKNDIVSSRLRSGLTKGSNIP